MYSLNKIILIPRKTFFKFWRRFKRLNLVQYNFTEIKIFRNTHLSSLQNQLILWLLCYNRKWFAINANWFEIILCDIKLLLTLLLCFNRYLVLIQQFFLKVATFNHVAQLLITGRGDRGRSGNNFNIEFIMVVLSKILVAFINSFMSGRWWSLTYPATLLITFIWQIFDMNCGMALSQINCYLLVNT